MNVVPEVAALEPELRGWRRHLHAHPETAFEETATAAFVADKLRAMGLEVHTGLAGTGVVGVLKHGRSTEAVALRADLDALHIHEQSGAPHASKHAGRMHACGHDGHTTMPPRRGAGALAAPPHRRHRLFHLPAGRGKRGRRPGDGRVRALREIPGPRGGAACDNWPTLPVGQFALRAGPLMGAFDIFEIVATGKARARGDAQPGRDRCCCVARDRRAAVDRVAQPAPARGGRVSVTQVHAGDTWNVIPNEVVLRGTVRSFKPEVQDTIEQRLRAIVAGVAATFEMSATVRYERRYPATVNSEAETAHALAAATAVVGRDKVDTDPMPSMGSEDFAFMLQAKPGCYVWIGRQGPGHPEPAQPRYDFNDGDRNRLELLVALGAAAPGNTLRRTTPWPPRRNADLPHRPGVLFILVIGVAGLYILQPFLPAVIWATMIVVATWPFLMMLQARFGGSRTLAVTTMMLLLLVIVIAPLVMLITSIVGQAQHLSEMRGLEITIPGPPNWVASIPMVGDKVAAEWTEIAAGGPESIAGRLQPYMSEIGTWLLAQLGGLGGMIIHLFLTFIFCGVLYASGETGALGARRFFRRLHGARGDEIVVLAGASIRAVALGIVVTAVVQTVLGGIGLLVAGVPYVAVLSALMLVCCIAQIGPGLVLFGSVIWLYYTGSTGWAIGLSGLVAAGGHARQRAAADPDRARRRPAADADHGRRDRRPPSFGTSTCSSAQSCSRWPTRCSPRGSRRAIRRRRRRRPSRPRRRGSLAREASPA